jgi:hypothetical protein
MDDKSKIGKLTQAANLLPPLAETWQSETETRSQINPALVGSAEHAKAIIRRAKANPLDWYRWLRAWRRILWIDFVVWWYQVRAMRQLRHPDGKSVTLAQEAIDKWYIDAEIRRTNSPDGFYCDGCKARHSAVVFTNPNMNCFAKEFLCAECFLDSLLAETIQELNAFNTQKAGMVSRII